MAIGVRQQRGEATRNEILTVARRLFSDFGYHNTGISDIQSATGLTKGAFYHHFRAKQELALAVLEAARNDYTRHLIAPAKAQPTPGQRLSMMLVCAANLNGRPEWLNCRLLATLCAEVTAADGPLVEAVRGVQEQILDTLEQMVTEAQTSGEAAPGSPQVWAQLALSTMMGLLLVRKIGASRADPGDVLLQLRRGLLPGLELPSDPPPEPKSRIPRRVQPVAEAELY